MTIRRMRVSDFRCVRSADLVFDASFTLISGENAAGKTSLLEALYFLGRGRSFRTRRIDALVRQGVSSFVLFGEVDVVGRWIGLGLDAGPEGITGRVGGEPVGSLAQLAAIFPVQVIDPEVHRLIEEGPGERRRFLDWGLFHVERSFIHDWQNFRKVLRQRNTALRKRQTRDVVVAWDGELARLGSLIHERRVRYIVRLAAEASEIARSLLGLRLELEYRCGWQKDATLREALVSCWPKDVEACSTTIGPQRAELKLQLEGTSVKDRISRGQQKLLAAALLLAQLRLLADPSVRPTLLLDDPAAELDGGRLAGLIREVANPATQLIVTALNPSFDGLGLPGRRYSISNGAVKES